MYMLRRRAALAALAAAVLALPLAAAAAKPAAPPAKLFDTWEYRVMAWREAGKPAESVEVWGTLVLRRNGTWHQKLHIGDFLNDNRGRFEIRGRQLVLRGANGKAFATYTYSLDPRKNFLLLLDRGGESLTTFELELESQAKAGREGRGG
jgi:hypothetical protein